MNALMRHSVMPLLRGLQDGVVIGFKPGALAILRVTAAM
jgi:hypothetical protein